MTIPVSHWDAAIIKFRASISRAGAAEAAAKDALMHGNKDARLINGFHALDAAEDVSKAWDGVRRMLEEHVPSGYTRDCIMARHWGDMGRAIEGAYGVGKRAYDLSLAS